MPLIKRSQLSAGANKSLTLPKPKRASAAAPLGKPIAKQPKSQKEAASERLAAATEQLASGLTEAAAATRELGRSAEQIGQGAETAAAASHEQAAAVKRVVADLTAARGEADSSSRRTETVAIGLAETSALIATSVRAIERGAERQAESLTLLSELERLAKEVSEITRAVSRLSDQTNLLALNAAIEAARAGEEGRGFAVVADEVRALAESSDKSAREVQSLSTSIQEDVAQVSQTLKGATERALREAKSASGLAQALQARRQDMSHIAEGARAILTASLEAERAALEAQKGAEQIASAAEEQSSGAIEAQKAIEQQSQALDQGQLAAQDLAKLAEELRAANVTTVGVERISANAEELSASIQELSSAAAQVMAAVEQISRAAQLQSAATQQSAAALEQIERSARLSRANCQTGDERVRELEVALKQGRAAVESLIEGVSGALTDTRASLVTVNRLAGLGRRIEKIIDTIALIAVQTSMLAVSGSVEAARAGESGRGFAVVSHDIRNLASEASTNVERAKDTVRAIVDQIGMLKTDLQQVTTSAEIEVQNNQTVTTGLRQIETDVAALGVATRSILTGADNILAAATEMARAGQEISSAAEQAGAASRQAATAADQQSRGAEDLAAAIEEIATLADALKQSA